MSFSAAFGGSPFGGGAYFGLGSGTLAGSAIAFLEANDRNMLVACIADGTDGPPVFTYWNPALGPWAEALANPDPADYPPFYATDLAGAAPDAFLESKILRPGDGRTNIECQISGVLVDFMVRPTAMDSYDGGLGSLTPTFTLKVEGFGVAGISGAGDDALTSSVVQSSALTWTGTTADLSSDPWPHMRTERINCRLTQPVKGFRVLVTAAIGVEFLGFAIIGTTRSARDG